MKIKTGLPLALAAFAGKKGASGEIPPNATRVFEVELIGVKS